MKIYLRPFTRDEYHDFYRRYRPDSLMDPRPYRYHSEHVDRSFDYDLARFEWYPVFGIFNEDGKSVGTLSLKRIDQLYKRCELGITMVNDRYKNQGYGTAAIAEALRIAKERYGLQQILADTMGSNHRMQHLLEKFGFRLIGRTPQVYDMNDHFEDKLDYILDLNTQE